MQVLRQTVHDGPEAEGVKSADRVLALLELFRTERRPLGAREIASRLAIPRSSVTVLLRGLVAQGYLRFDRERGAYFPTLRVALLSTWLTQGLIDDPGIVAAMATLSITTQETICLWADAGNQLQIIRVVASPQPIALAMTAGGSAPIVSTAVGMAMLSLRDAKAVADAVSRHNREATRITRFDPALVMAEWRAAVTAGHVAAYNRWLPDAGAVAVGFRPRGGEPLVLAVGGPVFRIRPREADIADALHAAIRDHHLTK